MGADDSIIPTPGYNLDKYWGIDDKGEIALLPFNKTPPPAKGWISDLDYKNMESDAAAADRCNRQVTMSKHDAEDRARVLADFERWSKVIEEAPLTEDNWGYANVNPHVPTKKFSFCECGVYTTMGEAPGEMHSSYCPLRKLVGGNRGT